MKRKYFSAAQTGRFSARTGQQQGKSQVMALYRAAQTAIERHIKVRGMANPYDPHYTEYFERRRYSIWRVMRSGVRTGQTVFAGV